MRRGLPRNIRHDCVSLSVFAQAEADDFNIYSDVTPDKWYYEDIKYVHEKGIMNGVGDGKFAPNSTLTFRQFYTILYRAAGSPEALDYIAEHGITYESVLADMERARLSAKGK